MRLSESLRRGIMEALSGGIVNKFMMKRRRITLFFEDISANYIKLCEERGYKEEMRQIGEMWGTLTTEALAPKAIKELPVPLLSGIIKTVWANLGILEDFQVKRINDVLMVTVKKDAVTRIIGKNNFAVGCFGGVLDVYMDAELQLIEASQSRDLSEYVYKINKKGIKVKCKDKEKYNRLNALPYMNGYTLKDAIKSGVFHLSENRLYFRGKSICNSENTVFHIIGNRNILLEAVPEISYRYFSGIIDENTPAESKLALLKTLLQVMGWGIVKLIKSGKSIALEISYLPCGLQLEKENWDFLIMTILGYLRTVSARAKITFVTCKSRRIRVTFRI